MKLSIILATSEFRGDHGADVRIAFEAVPGETIEQLVERILKARRRYHADVVETDVIEIRPMAEEEPIIEAPPVIEAPPSGLIR